MSESDEASSLDSLEATIPIRAGAAFKAAFRAALDAGQSVLVAVDGKIVRISPNGMRTVVKSIAKPRHVVPGTRINLRSIKTSRD